MEVCWGPTCHLTGAPAIVRGLLDDLGLPGEGDTEDGRVSFKYNTCLGACSQAPVISVNHRLQGRVSARDARDRVAGLSANGHR